MKRLTLYAGLHKTGSTSIQAACQRNLRPLEQAGYLYPMAETTVDGRTFPDANQSGLIRAMFCQAPHELMRSGAVRQSPEFFLARQQSLRLQFAKTLAEIAPGHLLIVAEELSNLSVAEWRDLRQWFETLGYVIDVFCCVRPPTSWLNAMVAQEVMGKKSGRYALPEIIAKYETADGILLPKLTAMLEVFPDIRFYPFAQAIAHPNGPVGCFFDAAGIRFAGAYENLKENIGGSDHAVRLHSHINRHFGGRFAAAGNDAMYRQFPKAYPELYTIPGEKFRLRASETARLAPVLARENAWLRKRLGEDYCDRHEHLPDTVTDVREIRQHLAKALQTYPQPLQGVIEAYLAEPATA
jgi:hypothetical protein